MTFLSTENLQAYGHFVKQDNLYIIFSTSFLPWSGVGRRLLGQLFPSFLSFTASFCWSV